MRVLIAAVLVGCCLPAFAQQDIEDARRTVTAVEALLKQRPEDATLWFYLARYQSMAGDGPAAIKALQRVDELGEGFLPPRADFGKVWGDPAFQEARSRLEAKLPRLDYAPTAFKLEDGGIASEGIAYDRASKSFFVGGGRNRKVMRVLEDGSVVEFAAAPEGMDGMLGIAVDGPRRLLYVVSTSALTSEGRERLRNAVFAFDIDSRRLVQRYDVPGARQLNDVAIVPGGRVFASDSVSGAVHELPVKGPGPARELLKAGQILGANGITASPDGKRLYVAHSTGIVLVDIASGAMKRLQNRTRQGIGAIDGLYAWQGELVGVQNITNPGRVVRLQLSADGETVTSVKTLLSHHHTALVQPTTLAVTDHGFYLVAATGGAFPSPDAPPSDARLTVLRIPLP